MKDFKGYQRPPLSGTAIHRVCMAQQRHKAYECRLKRRSIIVAAGWHCRCFIDNVSPRHTASYCKIVGRFSPVDFIVRLVPIETSIVHTTGNIASIVFPAHLNNVRPVLIIIIIMFLIRTVVHQDTFNAT